MVKSHWKTALDTLTERKTGIYGPQSFRDYLRETGENPRDYRTAAEISIDTHSKLATELDQHDTMVLRLGSAPDGRGTQFVLVRVADQLGDFFINGSEYMATQRTELDFSPNGEDTDLLGREAQDMLAAYRLLPTFSESSLVNLALSTGLFSRALGLDVDRIGTAPTTIASTFDFYFEPHPAQPTVVHHNSGQVEIDGLVITQRDGKRVLLVIEAKTGPKRSLAKHKLCYPMLGVETMTSDSIDEVVPVYLHARSTNQGLRYDIYECTPPALGQDHPRLSTIEVASNASYLLRIE